MKYRRFLIPIVLAASLTAAGCTGRDERNPATAPAAAGSGVGSASGAGQPRPEPPPDTGSPGTVTLIPERTARPPARTPGNTAATRQIADPSQFRYGSGRDRRVYPEDFEIGPLQNLRSRSSDEAEIYRVVERFFTALGNGKIETASVHEEYRRETGIMLRFHIERRQLPSSIRIGRIRFSGTDHAELQIRLFGDPGRGTGEVFLERRDAVWRIADFQADLYSLSEPYEPSRFRFEPNDF